MFDIPDDPIIRSLERTGTVPWVPDELPICPICGEECDTAYYDRYGEAVGCECCIRRDDPYKDIQFLPGMAHRYA